MKVQNPEKLEKAKQLLAKGLTYTQVIDEIKESFNSGISPSTLAQLKRELPSNEKHSIDTQILKKLIIPFAKAQINVNLDEEEITRIKSLYMEVQSNA
jgi:hypothetical protein